MVLYSGNKNVNYFLALNEVGIYRVSGVTSDVQHFKKMFDKSKFIDIFAFYYQFD